MSHSLTLNSDLGVIVLRTQSLLSFDEICLVLKELPRLPGFREGLCLVADFRGSGTTLTGENMRQLAHYACLTDVAWGDTKWSTIASNDVLYGLSRMFATLTDRHHVDTHVFRNVAEADGWLGLGVEMDQILARTPEQ